MNVDLGCGEHKQIGFVGIDTRQVDGVDIVANLTNGIPLDDSVVDLLMASHILEHLPDTMFIMSEIWRVCKHGAQVAIAVPHYRSIGAWIDPTHVRAFTEGTFNYFDPRHHLYNIYKPKSTFFVEHLTWSTLGNIEVVLRVVKDKKYSPTQDAILKGEGLAKANKRTKRTAKKRGTKKKTNKSL